MAAKIIDLKSYKRKRFLHKLILKQYSKLNDLPSIQMYGIILNLSIVLLVGIYLTIMLFNPPSHIGVGRIFSFTIAVLTIHQFLKFKNIFKHYKVKENISYFRIYIKAVIISSLTLSLLSLFILNSPLEKLEYFLFCQIFFIPNIFLLRVLLKK